MGLRIKKPARRRPKSNYNEALGFIALAIKHMIDEGDPLHTGNVDKLKPLYSNYCKNTGLRGSQKDSVWNIVKSQIAQVKSSQG